MAGAQPVCLLWRWLLPEAWPRLLCPVSLCPVPSAEPVAEALWVFLASGMAGDGFSSPCALSPAVPGSPLMINMAKPCIASALAP